ncbi:hypothetical protein [Lihuaxuella thermophila]|uniref:Glycosyl transferases group 1 n=1 Tax=Lihuaxuella thermophila TaxID=1173111 RepID=A0A1H8GE62_9BACL|nr:hypothetical protein [Lihuaxuella thermophila]SEN42070.1 hypothetical protein SAMN05444955_1119 [Lihuaxuella thermophila]
MTSSTKTLCILYPSRLPDELTATFPPVLLEPDVTIKRVSSKDVADRDLELSAYGKAHLFNPPLSVIKQLPNHPSITLSFDTLPAQEMSSWIAPFTIQVPSLAFRSVLRRRGISAETIHPVPAGMNRPGEIRREVRKRYQLVHKYLLWVDERFLSPKYRSSVLQTLQKAVKEFPALQVLWVTKHSAVSPKGLIIADSEKVKQQKLWLAADLLLSIGSPQQSLVPLHLQALSLGIPVITAEGGDHDEWVNHLFSGVVLNRKYWQRELRMYLSQLVKKPSLMNQWRNNGRHLINCITGMNSDE